MHIIAKILTKSYFLYIKNIFFFDKKLHLSFLVQIWRKKKTNAEIEDTGYVHKSNRELLHGQTIVRDALLNVRRCRNTPLLLHTVSYNRMPCRTIAYHVFSVNIPIPRCTKCAHIHPPVGAKGHGGLIF